MKYNFECWDEVFLDKQGRYLFRLKPDIYKMEPCFSSDYLAEVKKAVKDGIIKPTLIDDIGQI